MQTTSSNSLALLKIVSYENNIAVLSGYLPSSTGMRAMHCKLIQISWAGLCFCMPTIFTHKALRSVWGKWKAHYLQTHNTGSSLKEENRGVWNWPGSFILIQSLTLTTADMSAQKGRGHITKNKDSTPADETYLRERNNLMGHFGDTY